MSRLDEMSVASPCSARWEDMEGDLRVRFCGKCEKNVYNLSAMPRAEAEALLVEREGSVCIRLYRRADGTVLTSDCPTGVAAKRVRRLVVLASGLAATLATAGCATTGSTGPAHPTPAAGWMTGAPPMPPPPPASAATANPQPAPTASARN